MSDFLTYYKQEEKRRATTEEEKLAIHKRQKEIDVRRHQLDEDDDFYNDPVVDENDEFYDEEPTINEGVRVPYKPAPAPRPVPRPAPQPVRKPAPVEPEPDFYDEPEDEPVVHTPRRRKQLSESMGNPALSEAYDMMNEMQQKIESAFYRYGMTGLEKINACMEAVFERIVNPPKPKPIVKYVERESTPIRRESVRPISVNTNVPENRL